MLLTDEQKRIIAHPGGHARIRAVAGSGKTTTMVERICSLLERGVAPSSLLVLMFNKSARDSFAESLQNRLVGSQYHVPEVRTFHALGLRLVDSFMRRGVLPKYRLVTEERYRENMARQVGQYMSQELGEDSWRVKEDLEEFVGFIDLVKANSSTPEAVAKEIDLPPQFSSFVEGYTLFEKARHQEQVRFYSELIADPLEVMASNEEIKKWVANRVDYIIVDEYQDINESQQQLLRLVAGSRADVMVVGDGDQCIYEWRGAKPEYISHRFAHDFANPVDYSLSATFRYGHKLSLMANHLIVNNLDEKRSIGRSFSDNFHTDILCQELVPGKPHPVVDISQEWQKNGRSLAEAVVLVRLYAMSVPIELALLKAGVPYTLQGGSTVFKCPEIQALTGYLRLCDGSLATLSQDESAVLVMEMLSQPHIGIKKSNLEQLAATIASDPLSAPSYIQSLITAEVPGFRRKRLGKLAETWQWLIDQPEEMAAGTILKQLVARLDLYSFYHDFSARQAVADNRIQTCESLIGFATEHKGSAREFLRELGLLQCQDVIGADRLLITSIHRAKGLEWPLVILPGLDQGSFPCQRASKDAGNVVGEGVEDERRLFYVGITRAKEMLQLIHPPDYLLQESIKEGRAGLARKNDFCSASCFLYETNVGLSCAVGHAIETGAKIDNLKAVDVDMVNLYLQMIGADCGSLAQTKEIPKILETTTVAGVADRQRLTGKDAEKGMAVVHDRFGRGTITVVVDKKQGRVKVSFEHHGEMVLLLAYAKVYLGE